MTRNVLISLALGLSLCGPCALGQDAAASAPAAAAPGSRPRTDEIAPVITPSGKPEPNAWRRFPSNILADQKAIWTSPFRMSRQDAPWWILFGGATAGLIAGDRWMSRQLPNTNDQIAVATWSSRLGAAYSIIPITGAFYVYGRLTGSPRARETGRLGLETLVDAAIVNVLLKTATDRERPLEGNGNGTFWSEKGSVWNASFPSGHATYSFALASVVAHEFPRPVIVPITAYGLATTVAASRFAARKHFASDIVAAGAMGWFIGHYVYGKRHNAEIEAGPGLRSWLSDHVEFRPVLGRMSMSPCANPLACGSAPLRLR